MHRWVAGEDRSQVGIMLSKAVHHGASGYILKCCLEVKGDQNSGSVRFSKVLDRLDHFVCSVLATHAVLCCRDN